MEWKPVHIEVTAPLIIRYPSVKNLLYEMQGEDAAHIMSDISQTVTNRISFNNRKDYYMTGFTFFWHIYLILAVK